MNKDEGMKCPICEDWMIEMDEDSYTHEQIRFEVELPPTLWKCFSCGYKFREEPEEGADKHE